METGATGGPPGEERLSMFATKFRALIQAGDCGGLFEALRRRPTSGGLHQ